MLPKEDRYFMTKPELFDKITGLLGGRVAEEVIFGEVSTGASNDFERATGIARKMITEYGMRDKIGPLQLDRKSTRLNSSHVATSYAVSCLKKKTISKPCTLRLQPN